MKSVRRIVSHNAQLRVQRIKICVTVFTALIANAHTNQLNNFVEYSLPVQTMYVTCSVKRIELKFMYSTYVAPNLCVLNSKKKSFFYFSYFYSTLLKYKKKTKSKKKNQKKRMPRHFLPATLRCCSLSSSRKTDLSAEHGNADMIVPYSLTISLKYSLSLLIEMVLIQSI